MKECYALEKLHGTSADVTWKANPSNKSQRQLVFHSGGESHNKFVALFDTEKLTAALNELGLDPDKDLTIYGEAYGGSCQKMSETYGPQLKFAVFDIQIGDCWLDVQKASDLTKQLGLEFVHFEKVSTDLASLDAQRDANSVQAVRNGITEPKKREGVVLRPLFEIRLNDREEAGHRLIAKHKGDDFKETTTARPVVDPAKMAVLDDANKIAEEWVTATRLQHVLDKLPGHCMEKMRDTIAAMQADVKREGEGEIVWSEGVAKSIGKKTVDMYKNYLRSQMS